MGSEINQFNLNAGTLNKYKNVLHYNTFWHQIVVENVDGLDRDAVLRTIMKFCQPLHFIPVHYRCNNNVATFLLKNSGPALQKLCRHNLIVINPFNNDKPFKITIKLCHARSNDLRININVNLTHILNKRFNELTGVLNLENFAKDTELEEYCALSQPKLFFYILHIAKHIQFKTLKLANNDIEFLQPMEALDTFKSSIIIDLRNNNIKEMNELNNMRHLHVLELWLDGNPVCDNFNEITYGKAVRERLEKLEKLDGINVQLKGFLPFRRNFLCSLTGYDLVDQFLEHYFTLYDAQNRSLLQDLYDKEALFSLTSMYVPGQTTSATAKLSQYKMVSRNLKHISDFSKSTQCLRMGPYPIIQMLSSLPATEHDPFSFAADLIMYTETAAVLVVSGVFRESSDSLLESDRLMGFSRTFVLLACSNGEYLIINEMLNITNATNVQASRAFKQIRVPKSQFIHIPQPQNEKEQLEIAETLTVITGMRTEWSRKCLQECKYDMRDTLNLFIELFKKDKVPKSAFLSDQEKQEAIIRLKNTTPLGMSPSGNTKPARSTAISFKENTQRIMDPSVGVAQPSTWERSGVLSLKKVAMSSQGPLSPEQIWEKFSSFDKDRESARKFMQANRVDVASVSPPDMEPLTNSSNEAETMLSEEGCNDLWMAALSTAAPGPRQGPWSEISRDNLTSSPAPATDPPSLFPQGGLPKRRRKLKRRGVPGSGRKRRPSRMCWVTIDGKRQQMLIREALNKGLL